MVLVDFGRKKWFSSILTEKTGFSRFWPKNVILADSGSFWVIWGFLMSFLNWKLYFLWIFEVNYWFHGDSNPGPPVRESDIMTYTTTTGFQKFSPVKPIYYLGGRPLGTKPAVCDFPPLGVRSAETQNAKKLRNFWEKLLGRTHFPPKSSPSSGKLCFSVFSPEFL